MDGSRLLLWLLLTLVGGAYAFWIYLRRELPVPGRPFLALLRAGALGLLFLLLLNPSLPGGGLDAPAWVLVDVSPSMEVVQRRDADGDRTPAERLSGAGEGRETRVLSFGDGSGTVLAPGLARALESGASRVEVRTDLRLADPVAVAALLGRSPVPVSFRDVGGGVANAGVADLRVDPPEAPGRPVEGLLTVGAEGVVDLRIRARVAGVPALDTTLTVPDGGRLRLPLSLQPPDTTGPVPVTLTVEAPGDAYPADDTRVRVVSLEDDGADVILVSEAPDWEPRFLLPVLAEVTGLRVQGFLRVGSDAWLTMRGTPERRTGSRVAMLVDQARLVVVHGDREGLPRAVDEAVAGAPAVLTLPAESQDGGLPGEWFLAGELPASPVAGELVGALSPGLPPLLAPRGTPDGPGDPVLELQRSGTGATLPALVVEEIPGGRRVARGQARGFWRWAFRGEEGRALYRRLWSGVAGWLLSAPAATADAAGLGPLSTVSTPGAPLAWRAGPAPGGTLSVTMEPMAEAGTAAPMTTPVDSLGRAELAAPGAPGLYRWRARVEAQGAPDRAAAGLLVVEAPSGDLLPGRAVSLLDVVSGAETRQAAGDGRPLRTHPAPYVLLVVLLSLEWVGRRRSGLR